MMNVKRESAASRPSSFIIHHSSFIIAFLLGALTVTGYAPFRLFPLPVATLAGLFYLLSRQTDARRAALSGYAFGLGLFLFGVSWVYVSLHDFGAMPMPVAVAVTFLFCAFLALFPAAVAYACARSSLPPVLRYGLLAPPAWMLAEWVRSWIFTGFPWLALGYSQVPASPLAGYAAVLGIHGLTLATAASAGLLAGAWLATMESSGSRKRLFRFILHPSSFILAAIWLGGAALKPVEWTEPTGEPFSVSLLQGNIPQDLKWDENRVPVTLKTYASLVESSSARLIVLPETALPLYLDLVPQDYLLALRNHARANGGDILIGAPERQANGEYFNSVVSLGAAPTQTYRKSHLVPFGEFIPLRPVLGWIVSVLSIPLQDFSRGTASPRPLEVAGQKVAVNICYEDAFGEEIIRQLPEATLLVNASNVAWFGRSIAPEQHLQISQARALETGRYLLRATNTGVTAVIGPDGTVLGAAPEFSMTAITHRVQGYRGATPYVVIGNAGALILALLLGVAALAIGRHKSHSAG